MHQRKRTTGALWLLAAVAITMPTACERSREELVEQARELRGLRMTIRVYAEPSDALWKAIGEAFDRVEQVQRLLSEWVVDSDVSKVNEAAGATQPVVVSAELVRVLEVARQVSEQSNGAFDVTWAVLRQAWGDFQETGIDPLSKAFRAKVERLRTKVDWKKVEIDPAASTVRLVERGMQIGLGGIAKGFAIDEAAAVLRRLGFHDFVIDASGDLLLSGRRGGRDWTVGIRHPRGPAGETFAQFPLRDRAIATTGDYERFLEVGGQRWPHMIDPATGFPATRSVSATVIHTSAMLADALATAAFVLGPAQGLELVSQFPGAEAVIVDPNLAVHVSPGLQPWIGTRWLKESKRETR